MHHSTAVSKFQSIFTNIYSFLFLHDPREAGITDTILSVRDLKHSSTKSKFRLPNSKFSSFTVD